MLRGVYFTAHYDLRDLTMLNRLNYQVTETLARLNVAYIDVSPTVTRNNTHDYRCSNAFLLIKDSAS